MINREVQFKGLPISGGIAFAKICLFNENRHDRAPAHQVEGPGIERETARIEQAVKVASERTQALVDQIQARLGSAQAGIFVAQKMMVEDAALYAKMLALIEHEGLNAEAAVTRALDEYEAVLSAIDNQYLRERASDIGEIKRRLLDVLGNTTPSLQCDGFAHCQRGKNRVVAAVELTPSLTTELDTDNLRGFITEHGGAGSHAAILARALGIPAVSGLAGSHSTVTCGNDVIVDGDRGLVILWPTRETLASYKLVEGAVVKAAVDIEPAVPSYQVMANASRFKDIEKALAAGAEGIGLYRTEFGVFVPNRILDEQEQYDQYVRILEMMGPRPVTIRLLDLGGDKGGEWLNLPPEENPQLGLRGSRLLLARRDLFDAQARALARASVHGPVNVMYPMIVDAAQFLKMREAFENAVEGVERGTLRHGVMFEVPAACLHAGQILEHAEFGSIGTNDLTQYLFAVDRNNELVAEYYNPDAPAFWALIRMTVDAAAHRGRPLSVCGEMAGDEQFVERFIELGIKSVSVSSRLIARTRRTARKILGSQN
ncbi:MAG TPA: phosphoenolpyruvate--protein phosphotransferase [Candidatus Bathyarchaeia archaeon]|nr:phosphoenolpyruvate--protein phosphotransferase [Candidatus Bathyarchaeia archaeon]